MTAKKTSTPRKPRTKKADSKPDMIKTVVALDPSVKRQDDGFVLDVTEAQIEEARLIGALLSLVDHYFGAAFANQGDPAIQDDLRTLYLRVEGAWRAWKSFKQSQFLAAQAAQSAGLDS